MRMQLHSMQRNAVPKHLETFSPRTARQDRSFRNKKANAIIEMLVALHTKYPCQFIRHSRLRASVSSTRSLSRSPCVAMNIFGGLFGSKGESKVENTDGNDNVLKWARSAKPETKLAPANAPEGEELATFAGVSIGWGGLTNINLYLWVVNNSLNS
jgi:hypothetical protein